MKTDVVRTCLIGFIWLATAIDVWCCQWLTPDGELNPLASWILVEYGVWTLVSWKIAGTFVVTEWLRHAHFAYTVFVATLMAAVLLALAGVFPL